MRLLPWKNQIAVDLGTSSVHISVKDGGVVVREPTVIAFSGSRRRPVAYGAEAKQMLDRVRADKRHAETVIKVPTRSLSQLLIEADILTNPASLRSKGSIWDLTTINDPRRHRAQDR